MTQSRPTVATFVGILIFSVAAGTLYTPRQSGGLHLIVDVQLPSGSAINAEVSTSWSALERGLMGRSSLARGSGMLFMYPKVGRHRHWMYECLFPLDIVWLSDDKHIVEIVPSVRPCPTVPRPSYGQTTVRVSCSILPPAKQRDSGGESATNCGSGPASSYRTPAAYHLYTRLQRPFRSGVSGSHKHNAAALCRKRIVDFYGRGISGSCSGRCYGTLS